MKGVDIVIESKFRGKGIFKGEWFYGDLLKYEDERGQHLQIVTSNKGCRMHNHTVDPATVGQFTGVKGICKDDIIDDYFVGTGVIEYLRGAFRVNYGTGTCKWLHDFLDRELNAIEIIGNIHDNPELLEA